MSQQPTASQEPGSVPAFDQSVWRVVGDPGHNPQPGAPLAGASVAVKDLFAIAGQQIGAGNPTYLAQAKAEPTTATAVADLLHAGATVRGIARTDEFAYSLAGNNPHYGTPPNPARPQGLPGGSSNGVGAAVALGQAEIGLGTDTAGSIRVPASYQGLWGLRTTYGSVPRQGLLPLAQSFDTVGWITRDPGLLRTVTELGVDSDPDTPLPRSLAVPAGVSELLTPQTGVAFASLLHDLRNAGWQIEEVDLGDAAEQSAVFAQIQGAEAWRNNGAWIESNPDALGEPVASRFATSSTITSADEQAAREAAAQWQNRFWSTVADHTLIFPTVPGPAPARAQPPQGADPGAVQRARQATLSLTVPASLGGLPSLSVPLLNVQTDDGPAPVGIALTGAPDTDLSLVDLGITLAALMDRNQAGADLPERMS